MNLLNQAPRFTEMGLILLTAYLFFTWLFPTEDAIQSLDPIEQASVSVKTASLLKAADVPLFGKAPPKVQMIKPVKKQQVPVVRTPLNIRLLGIMAAGKASAVVVLLPGKSEQQLFFTGDYIQPGVKLHYVDSDAMVIERSGRLERLVLEHSARLDANTAGNSDSATDMSTLMTRAKLELHHDDDKADGFLISGIVVNSIYHKLGLYNGDVIRKINGTQLLRTDQVGTLYDGMNSESIKLEIMRAGKFKLINYTIPTSK